MTSQAFGWRRRQHRQRVRVCGERPFVRRLHQCAARPLGPSRAPGTPRHRAQPTLSLPLPMTLLTLVSPIPRPRSVTARSAHVTAIVFASRSSLRFRKRIRSPSRLSHQAIPPRRIAPYRLPAEVRFIGRSRRRSRAFSPRCPARIFRTNDPGTHGHSRPDHRCSEFPSPRPNILRLP